MEEVVLIVLFVVIPVAILVFVLPIVATVKAARAKSQIEGLKTTLSILEEKVAGLSLELEALKSAEASPETGHREKDAVSAEEQTHPAAPIPETPAPAPVPTDETGAVLSPPRQSAPYTAQMQEAEEEENVSTTEGASGTPAEKPSQPNETATPAEDLPEEETLDTAPAPTAESDAETPPSAEPAPPPAEKPESETDTIDAVSEAPPTGESAPKPSGDADEKKQSVPPFGTPGSGTSIEERIGVVWFTRIGAVVGMIAAAWFFKYMVDNDWIGPWGRIALGALVGGAFLGVGEFLYRRGTTHPMFNQGLLGLGLSLLLITAYACFGFYHLVSAVTAFGFVGVLCFLGGALSHYHKSELILVFSLLAAFLNPILLSTGTDRPVALFSYLLLMTGAAFVPAVVHGFRVAGFVAPAGVVLLFVGWYAKYFDLSPAPAAGIYDAPEMNLPGAYFSMAVRWIPLLFAALFTGEWIGVALIHIRKARRTTGIVLLLIAAAASHGAAAALLYDMPLALGTALLALGLLFAVLFIKNDLTGWLFLTMGSSFVILAALRGRVDIDDILPVMTISGLLSTFYFALFLRFAVQKDRRPSPLIQWLIAGSGIGFFLIGALFLMPNHPLHLAGFSTVLTGIFLLTAVVIASPALSIGASVTGFFGLVLAGAERAQEAVPAFIAVAGAWFLLHTAVIAYDALKRRKEWTAVHLAVLSFAGIGFAGLFLQATPEDAGTLRALLAIGEGIVYLLVGISALRSEAGKKHATLLPLGMAALSFTAATAFLLSGASLTAAWAAEAAVLAYLASKSRDDRGRTNPGWTIASTALFLTAISHLFAVDLEWIKNAQNLYLQTQGAEGTLLPTPFMHPSAWALIALSAGLLAAVIFLRGPCDRLTKSFRLGFLFTGHGGLLWLLIREFRLMFTPGPDIPPGIPTEEMVSLFVQYQSSLTDQAMQLQTVTTVVLGVFALLLIAIGFVVRDAWHRRLGMVLFAVTLVKLTLFDIWMFETLLRIIVGGATALLLLLSGFLYARFGHRLKSIVTDNSDKFMGIAFLLAINAAPTIADTNGLTEMYRQSAKITGITAPGDYVIEVPPSLYQAGSARTPLADIRIVGPDGVEVPYALFSAEEAPTPELRDTRLLDPQEMPDGAFRAVLDLGEAPPVHHRLHLNLAGSDYLRTVLVESSADGTDFGVIQDNERVYRIPSAHSDAEKKTVDYPASAARYLRVTVQKGMDDRMVRITGARCEALGKRVLADATREIAVPTDRVFQDTDGNTVYPTAALPAKIPFDTLRIETPEREFVRRIQISDSTHKNAWFDRGTWTVFRIRRGPDAAAGIAERLTMPIGRIRRPFIRLKIDNGDNPPLDITALYARYEAEALVIRTPSAGPHTLLVDNKDAQPPRYDLAALLSEGSFTQLRPARLGPIAENRAFRRTEEKAKPTPWTESHARLIQIAVLILALFLLIWTVRLLKKSKKA